MVRTTRAQRAALKRLFDRGPIYRDADARSGGQRMSYREFRKTIQTEIGGFGAIMVPWAGMWVGIEKDGYTHS